MKFKISHKLALRVLSRLTELEANQADDEYVAQWLLCEAKLISEVSELEDPDFGKYTDEIGRLLNAVRGFEEIRAILDVGDDWYGAKTVGSVRNRVRDLSECHKDLASLKKAIADMIESLGIDKNAPVISVVEAVAAVASMAPEVKAELERLRPRKDAIERLERICYMVTGRERGAYVDLDEMERETIARFREAINPESAKETAARSILIELWGDLCPSAGGQRTISYAQMAEEIRAVFNREQGA